MDRDRAAGRRDKVFVSERRFTDPKEIDHKQSHDRRQVVHYNVTQNPIAQWTAQQIVEAFPFDTAPHFLLRDRDCVYGEQLHRRVKSLGIKEVIAAPRSPWQSAYVERLIGKRVVVRSVVSV